MVILLVLVAAEQLVIAALAVGVRCHTLAAAALVLAAVAAAEARLIIMAEPLVAVEGLAY
jgi:hypothetical protein